MIIYILIAVLLAFNASMYSRYNLTSKKNAFFLINIFLVLFAALRGRFVDVDTALYVGHIENLPTIDLCFTDFKSYMSKLPPPELSFCLYSSFWKYFFNDPTRIVTATYAILGITIKLHAIRNLEEKPFLGYAIFIYFCHFFLLQDMTQMRAGVATGLFLLAIPEIYNRNFKKYLLLILLATLIHKSAFVALPLYLLKKNSINLKLWLTMTIVLLSLALLKIDFMSILIDHNIPILSDKLRNYIKMQSWIQLNSNPFNTFLMLQLAVTCTLSFYQERVKKHLPYLAILLKINFIAILLFYFFFRVSAFAYRFFDFFSCVSIILIPMMFYTFKPRYLSSLMVICIGLCMLLFDLFYAQLMNPYYLCFFD